MGDDMVPAEESHNDGIEHICDALMESGLWQEIDGDGTEYSIIADHIGQLVRERADLEAENERLRAALDRAQLLYIEASNPGIDMDEVKRHRAARGGVG